MGFEWIGTFIFLLLIAVSIQAIRNPKKTIMHAGHRIEVSYGLTERVRYDGRLMSQKTTWFGATHVFQVEENGEIAEYDAEIRSGVWGAKVTVRRNGVLIYGE